MRQSYRYSTATVASTTTAYSVGDLVGSLLTFNNVCDVNSPFGTIKSAICRDNKGVATNQTLYIFDSNPTTSTLTENAMVALSNADLAKVIAVIDFANFSVTGTAGTAKAVCGMSNSNSKVFPFIIPTTSPTQTDCTLYGILVSNEAVTFNANGLTISLGVECA